MECLALTLRYVPTGCLLGACQEAWPAVRWRARTVLPLPAGDAGPTCDAELDALLARMPHVRRLSLSRRTWLRDPLFDVIAGRCRQLRHLDLTGMRHDTLCDNAALGRMIEACPELRELVFDESNADDAMMDVVGRAPQLRWLSVRHTRVSDAGLDRLACPRLERIDVVNSHCRTEGLLRLAARTPSLWRFGVDRRTYSVGLATRRETRALAVQSGLPVGVTGAFGMERLDLRCPEGGVASLLAVVGGSPALKHLRLTRFPKNADLESLVTAVEQGCPNLRSLDLDLFANPPRFRTWG